MNEPIEIVNYVLQKTPQLNQLNGGSGGIVIEGISNDTGLIDTRNSGFNRLTQIFNFWYSPQSNLDIHLAVLDRKQIVLTNGDFLVKPSKFIYKIIFTDQRPNKSKDEIIVLDDYSYDFYDLGTPSVAITNNSEKYDIIISNYNEIATQNDVYYKSILQNAYEALTPRIIGGTYLKNIDKEYVDNILSSLKDRKDVDLLNLLLRNNSIVQPYLIVMENINFDCEHPNYNVCSCQDFLVSMKNAYRNMLISATNTLYMFPENPLFDNEVYSFMGMLFSLKQLYDMGYLHGDCHDNNFYRVRDKSYNIPNNRYEDNAKYLLIDFGRTVRNDVDICKTYRKIMISTLNQIKNKMTSEQTNDDLSVKTRKKSQTIKTKKRKSQEIFLYNLSIETMTCEELNEQIKKFIHLEPSLITKFSILTKVFDLFNGLDNTDDPYLNEYATVLKKNALYIFSVFSDSDLEIIDTDSEDFYDGIRANFANFIRIKKIRPIPIYSIDSEIITYQFQWMTELALFMIYYPQTFIDYIQNYEQVSIRNKKRVLDELDMDQTNNKLGITSTNKNKFIQTGGGKYYRNKFVEKF